jgi:endoribonuclease Dicer
MGVDLWGEDQWRVILARCDVVVLTAQIFLDLLAHGFVSFDQVCT